MWQPDKRQWRVIATVFVVASSLWLGDGWFFGRESDDDELAVAIVGAGMLLVWFLDGKRK